MKQLDFIPYRSESVKWTTDENGLVVITMENKGIFDLILQKLMKKPKRSYIHLDEKGSFFWLNADGLHTLGEIAEGSAEKFGDASEASIYAAERFLETLCSCKFIKK